MIDRLIIDILIENWRKNHKEDCKFPCACHCLACELDARWNYAKTAESDLTEAILKITEAEVVCR